MTPKLLFTGLLLFITWAAAAQSKLSYDGYYRTLPDSLNPFTFYLRFYPDSTVIGTSTAGNPNNLKPWFKKEHTPISKGAYTLLDSTLKFALTSEEGVVEYNGALLKTGGLWLQVKSRINKYAAREEYFFMKMEGIR